MTSRLIVLLADCEAAFLCFPECPGVSFIFTINQPLSIGLLITLFFFLPSSHPLSFFFSSLSASPGSRTQQHLPPKRAQGGGLVSHHQRPETEDWTPERSQRLNRRSVVYGVSVSNWPWIKTFFYRKQTDKRGVKMSVSVQAGHPGGSHQLSDPRQQQNRRTQHHCAVRWSRATPSGFGVSLHPQPQHHNGCSVQKLSQVVIILSRAIFNHSYISMI